jgi:hypothetical protein
VARLGGSAAMFFLEVCFLLQYMGKSDDQRPCSRAATCVPSGQAILKDIMLLENQTRARSRARRAFRRGPATPPRMSPAAGEIRPEARNADAGASYAPTPRGAQRRGGRERHRAREVRPDKAPPSASGGSRPPFPRRSERKRKMLTCGI